MNNPLPNLYLMTNAFSSYAGETDYVLMKLEKKDLLQVVEDIAPMASELEKLTGSTMSSVNIRLGETNLIQEPDDLQSREDYHRMEQAISEDRGDLVLELFEKIKDDAHVHLGGSHFTVFPSERNRMTVNFAEKFGDDNQCSESLVPSEVLEFYKASVTKRNNNPEAVYATQMGDWFLICA